jgi:hypothetical protein
MPNRILRDWTDSLPVDSLDWQSEVLFVRVIMKVDDHGRFTANPKLLRSLCFPLRSAVRESDITRCLAACQKAGVLRLYVAEGKPFLEIVRFGQQVRSRSKCPDPEHDITCEQLLSLVGGGFGGVSVVGDVSGAKPPTLTPKKVRATQEEVVAYCSSLGLPATDGEWLFHKWEGNGWTNSDKPIKDWQATVRSWKAAGYMASQKPSGRIGGTPIETDKQRTYALTEAEQPKLWKPPTKQNP